MRSCLILGALPGLGLRRCKRLCEWFGSAASALQQVKAWAQAGIGHAAAEYFSSRAWVGEITRKWRLLERAPISYLLFADEAYPEYVRRLPDAPLVLWYEGNLDLLKRPGVAIVGSRTCGPAGRTACHYFARSLSEAGTAVISGLAAGVDAEAHTAALQGPGGTIAIMGTGLDITYPAKNLRLRRQIATSGLVMTEFFAGTRPERKNFPQRNRIIAAMSQEVFVIEASEKSGSLITARLAAEMGRPVRVYPGRCGSSSSAGCAKIMREGALTLVDLGDGAGDSMAPRPTIRQGDGQISRAAGKDGNLDERIVCFLQDNGPTHVDQLCAILQAPAQTLSPVLVLLEMEGRIRHFPGMVYGV